MNLHQILQELRIFLSSQDKRFPNEDVFASKFRLKEKSGPEPSRVCDNHFKHRDVAQKKTFEILTIRKCKMGKKLLEYISRQEKRDNWWNQMFMSSNDGPRPSLCCRTPVCLFSAWKMTKSCDFIWEIQQCIFYLPDRDAWRQDTEESLVVSSNCFFLGPFSTIPPPPMVLCPLAVFPEEAGQGRLQGQDSSSWTRSSSCSTRWSWPRGWAAPSLPRRQARQWTRSRRWNKRADIERILFF